MAIFINFWRFHLKVAIYHWRYETDMCDYFRFSIGYGLRRWELILSGGDNVSFRIIVSIPPFCDFNNIAYREVIKGTDGLNRTVNVFTGHIFGYKLKEESNARKEEVGLSHLS